MQGRPQSKSVNVRLNTVYILMGIPALMIIFIFIILPVIYNIVVSFTNFSLRTSNLNIVGFTNYQEFLGNENTPLILKNTFIYTFGVVIFQFLFGFIAAMIMNYIGKGRGFFSAILFMPWVVSQVLAVTAWKLLFQDSYGLVNLFLKTIGQNPKGWLSDPSIVLYVVMMLNIWAGYGFTMTLMLSALKSVPTELYEAARVDGAGWWKSLFRITLPMIVYSVATNIILITIYTFNVFAYVFALTNGGPLFYTEVLGLTMYKAAFVSGRLGYGASIAVMMILVNLVMALIYFRVFRATNSDEMI